MKRKYSRLLHCSIVLCAGLLSAQSCTYSGKPEKDKPREQNVRVDTASGKEEHFRYRSIYWIDREGIILLNAAHYPFGVEEDVLSDRCPYVKTGLAWNKGPLKEKERCVEGSIMIDTYRTEKSE